MHRFLDFKPLHGFLTSLFSFCLGLSPEAATINVPQVMLYTNIQNDTVFIFQLIAFTVTIVAGVLTAVNAWMRYCDRRKIKQDAIK
jgi:hypothetical protein